MDISLIFACSLVAIMGLPHGALDPFVAYRSGLIKDLVTALGFIFIYVLTMCVIILSWWMLPEPMLIIFLLLSAYHFGRDWGDIVDWRGFGYGALVVGLPALTQTTQVTQIFSFLLFGVSPLISIQILQIIGLVGAIVVLVNSRRLQWQHYIQIAGLVGLSLLVSPLWYFVCYFCLLHSPHHLWNEISKIPHHQRHLAYLIILATTLVTVAIFVVATIFQFNTNLNMHASIYQSLFIGLAALTVPHMFLLEWADRR